MTEPDDAFGPFGTPRSRKGGLPPWRTIVLGFLAGVVLPTAIFGWLSFYTTLVERGKPTVELIDPPYGIGVEPRPLALEIADGGAGLGEVIVRVEQESREWEVFRKTYPAKTYKDRIELILDREKLKLKNGEASLSVVAFDRTIWSNVGRETLSLTINSEVPAIELYQDALQVPAGGTGVLTFGVKGGKGVISFLTIDEYLFPGFPAASFDPEFSRRRTVQFAWVPIPTSLGTKSTPPQLRVTAKDAVGNFSSTLVPLKVVAAKREVRKLRARGQDFETTAQDQFAAYLRFKQRMGLEPTERDRELDLSDDQQIEHLGEWADAYEGATDKFLRDFLKRRDQNRVWDREFLNTGVENLRAGFGDRVEWVLRDKSLRSFESKGIEYDVREGAIIRALNAGTVIFADELGSYGKTVILDHGFGLVSVYAHLSAWTHLEGKKLDQGDEVGEVGGTGLIDGASGYYELRLHGVPVDPSQWASREWNQRALLGSFDSAKRKVGIPVKKPID